MARRTNSYMLEIMGLLAAARTPLRHRNFGAALGPPIALFRLSRVRAGVDLQRDQGHFTSGGSDMRMASTLPPVFSPKIVPRS